MRLKKMSNKLKFKMSLILIVTWINCFCISVFAENTGVRTNSTNNNSTSRVYSSETSGTSVNNNNSASRVISAPSSSTSSRVGVSSSPSPTRVIDNPAFPTTSSSNSSNSPQTNSSSVSQQPDHREVQTPNEPKPEPAKSQEVQKPSPTVAQKETTPEEKSKDETEEEKPKPPADLPPVEDEEIAFPEVATPVSAEKESDTNYIAGIAAWAFILAGIAMVFFIMIKGKSGADVPIQSLTGAKKRRRKGKHLLPDNYYREKI